MRGTGPERPSRHAPEIEAERESALHQLEDLLETPMVVLGFVWLLLLVVELVRGAGPLLHAVGTAIWIAFILDFGLRFALASDRWRYLRRNALTALSLVLPAVRVLRVANIARAARTTRAIRGLRLARLVTSMNRGMRALRATMSRRGLAYVLALTLVVVFAGAAGMYALEPPSPEGHGFRGYGDALWWTAMIVTTMGSESWPRSGEGRILCLVLAVYAFAVFGYVTAAIASFFVGRDAEDERGEIAGAAAIERLRAEIEALRAEIGRMAGERMPRGPDPSGAS
jgi:voltage-gated potassium channel